MASATTVPPSAATSTALNPARSRQWELGLKARFAGAWLADAAYFEARTSDEIAVLTNTGGRTVFRNAGRTGRKGFEFGISGPLGAGFSFHGAATALAASYRHEFSTCNATPCAAPVLLVPAGNRLPGAPCHSLYAELQWQRPAWGFETAVELRRVADVLVDDLNTMAADGYTVANLRLSWQQHLGRWSLREFVRIDNLADRQHAGSVIVNEGNARYFEAAPGRNWLVGVSAAYRY